VLDVEASEGVSVERFDVEDDGNNVKLKPQPGAKVRSLFEKTEGNTGTEELGQVFVRERFERVENIILNLSSVFFRGGSVEWEDGRGKVNTIDRVVYGDGDLQRFTARND